jgi:ubiquitin carboxyl-terminal hydrolase 12/46
MGATASQLEKELANEPAGNTEHYFGLINFGNTCYCNSVMQALYFCRPFREKVLQYKQQLKKSGHQKENLLTCLAELFHHIASQKRKVGSVAPKKFIGRLKKENDLFDSFTQQDAHEFLNYLLNSVADIIMQEEKRAEQSRLALLAASEKSSGSNGGSSGGSGAKVVGGFRSGLSHLVSPSTTTTTLTSVSSAGCSGPCDSTAKASPSGAPGTNGQLPPGQPLPSQPPHMISVGLPSPAIARSTWIQEIFQGTLTNETRCLNCETLSSKDEDFLDLSVDVDQNTSITHCLQEFSSTETLCAEHKYFCDVCCSKQEAQKRMRIKKLPQILALHLKRFKYMEHLNRYAKLSYRVLFPLELQLFNVSDDALNPNRLYDLVAVVVHCGQTPNRGHYICIVKSHSFWLLFDDDIVEKLEATSIDDFFGLSESGPQKNSESAYILFYQGRDV